MITKFPLRQLALTLTYHIKVTINRDKNLDINDGEMAKIMKHGHHRRRHFPSHVRQVSLEEQRKGKISEEREENRGQAGQRVRSVGCQN